MRFIVCPYCDHIQSEEPRRRPGVFSATNIECEECHEWFRLKIDWVPDYETWKLKRKEEQ